MTPNQLGRRIRRERERRGLSIPELAEKAGLDRSDLWRIEHGKGPKSLGYPRLERIAKALGVSLSSLFAPSEHNGES